MRGTTNIGHSETGRTSHRALRLAKLHLRDWGVLIVLLILDRVLASLHPFNRFVGKYMLDDLRYPLKANTVPFWAVTVFDGVTDEVECHGDPQTMRDGHKSFPSGHAAWSFSGLGFFSLYLAGKIRIFDQKGHVSKLTIILAPLAAAAYISLSRVNDYKHHWQDIFAGALLGLTVATLSYRQFFPALYNEFCMLPYRAHESRLTNNQNASAEDQDAIHQSPTPVNGTVTDMEMGRSQHESN